jgi:flagellar hook-associated protein 2
VTEETRTVGDLVDELNQKLVGVEAQINDTGDAIQLIDSAGGAGKLSVVEVNQATTAGDLHFLGTSTVEVIDTETVQVLTGGTRFNIEFDADDTLADAIEKINLSGADIRASQIGDGSVGNPIRLSLVGEFSGDAANLTFDTTEAGFTVHESLRARDALLLVGAPATAATGILHASKSNVFTDALPGVRLTVNGESTEAISVNVTTSDTSLLKMANDFVTNFNGMRKTIKDFTVYDAATNSAGLLIGSTETLRIETGFSSMLSGRFFGVGKYQSLEAVGIKLRDDGQLELDAARLQEVFAEDPEALSRFFTDENSGAAVKLDKFIDTLVGPQNSLLINRAKTLADKSETSSARVASMDARLEKQREKLLTDFARMESAISKLQGNLTALNSLQIVPPLTSTRR